MAAYMHAGDVMQQCCAAPQTAMQCWAKQRHSFLVLGQILGDLGFLYEAAACLVLQGGQQRRLIKACRWVRTVHMGMADTEPTWMMCSLPCLLVGCLEVVGVWVVAEEAASQDGGVFLQASDQTDGLDC